MAAVGWDGRDVSGLSHEQIHRWTRDGASPDALAAARDRHQARADELRGTADRLRTAHRGVAETWIGRDADAAGHRTGALASRMEQLAETVSGQARGVEGMRVALLRVQAAVGPPRPPALPSLGAPPVLGELRALVTGAPADGFPAFRAAAAEQSAAREAYRTYLAETAAAARGVSTAGAGPPPPSAAPAAAPGPGGAAPAAMGGPTPVGAAATTRPTGTAAPAPSTPAGPTAARGATPVAGARGSVTGVLARAAAAPPGPAPPGDLPVGPRAVDAGAVPGGSGAAGAGPVPDRPGPSVPAPSSPPGAPSSPPGAASSRPGAAATDAGRATPGAAASRGADGVRPVPLPAAEVRRPDPRRTTRPGSAPDAGTAPDTHLAGGPDPGEATHPASPGDHPGATGTGGHGSVGSAAPGPLDAVPFGPAPVGGGAGEHRLPPRRTEYLVDPDPVGWGADATRRVAPPVLGEDDEDDVGDPAEPS
ncbi:hypothetical protein [Actinomycetospora sp.]|uniref:WXG100 family type VII secretion target n=1 Tax=Actinomycetospora sp. TaxID=1872135 RepID=UPI002F3F5044